MPKVVKKNQAPVTYDLRRSFASENRGKRFTSSKSLNVWVDTSLTTTKVGSLSVSYSGSPTTGTTTEHDFNYNFVELNGSSQFIEVADSDKLSFVGSSGDLPFTISLWVQIDAVTSADYFFSKGTSSGTREYFASITDSSKKISFQFYDESTDDRVLVLSDTTDIVGTERWHHIVFTYNGAPHQTGVFNGKVYVDGKDITIENTKDPNYVAMENLGAALRIGSAISGGAMDGKIAEVALFSKCLTPEEVLAIYDATTSGVRKVKSGIISNPPRHRIRQLDQKDKVYPSRLTMGDADNFGNYRNKPFNDNLSLRYGRKYQENFVLEEKYKPNIGFPLNFGVLTPHVAGTTRKLNSDWVTSRFMQVRQETITGEEGSTFNDGALVFAGNDTKSLHTTGSRWIRTAEKIKSPEVNFDLIVGPYDNRKSPDLRGLRLSRGKIADRLKIQCTTGSIEDNNWTTIKTINAVTASFNFTGLTSAMLATGADRNIVIPKPFSFDKRIKRRRIKRRNRRRQKSRIQVYLSPNDFKSFGNKDFYFRIIHETPSSTSKAIWAIGDITIRSANDNIVFPLGVDKNTEAYQNLFENYVASPNIPDSIEVKARSIAGLADKHIEVKNTAEDMLSLSPFKSTQSHASVNSSNSFFDIGTPGTVAPGFGNKLADKTQIVIDLSPKTQKTFGSISKCTHLDTDAGLTGSYDRGNVGNPQDLMIYWNNTTKTWDNVGKYSANMFSGSLSNNATGSIEIHKRIQGNVAGFAPIGQKILTASERLTVSELADLAEHADRVENSLFMSPEINQAQGLVTDTFGFPYAGQYSGNNQQVVRAKDYGITKPFLLEKCSLVFDGNFNIPPQHQVNGNGVYSKNTTFDRYGLQVMTDYTLSATNISWSLKTCIAMLQPTFFILRQFNKIFKNTKEVSYVTKSGLGPTENRANNIPLMMISGSAKNTMSPTQPTRMGTATKFIPEYSGSTESVLPRSNYATIEDVPKSTSRDLITYGRIMLAVSGSRAIEGNINNPDSQSPDHFNVDKSVDEFLESGFTRDLNIVVDSASGYDPSLPYALTGSYQLDFESRNTAALQGFVSSVVLHVTGTQNANANPAVFPVAVATNNAGGRETGDVSSGRRGIVNPVGAFVATENKSNVPSPLKGTVLSHTENLKFPIPSYDSLNQHSPYVIMPEDELIFGWQFGLPQDLYEGRVFKNTPDINTWSMTLRNNAKLYLYGSMIQDGKEFHDPRNQNLTSNAVHEIIGSEPIIDKWEISNMPEYVGTFRDRMVDSRFITASMTTHDGTRQTLVQQGLLPFVTGGFVRGPIRRLGAPVLSKIRQGHIDSVFVASAGEYAPRTVNRPTGSAYIRSRMPLDGGADVNTATSPSYFNKRAFKRHYTIMDRNRTYSDSRKRNGHYFRIGLTKGRDGFGPDTFTTHSYAPGVATQTVAMALAGVSADPGGIQRNLEGHISSSEIYASSSYGTYQTQGRAARPRYVFSGTHFGHYADLVRQARDSRYVITPRQRRRNERLGLPFDNITASPVRIRFVSGSETRNFRIRSYYLTTNPTFIGNKSKFSTASFGFIDTEGFAGDPEVEVAATTSTGGSSYVAERFTGSTVNFNNSAGAGTTYYFATGFR